MEAHYELSDNHLLTRMERATLDSKVFTHEAHLRWGWLLLEKFELDKAVLNACVQLKRYTCSLGASDKYNETVTIAAIRAIHHFRLKYPSQSFPEFISKAQRLKTSFKELLGLHYSQDIFELKMAKERYLEPDLIPFD